MDQSQPEQTAPLPRSPLLLAAGDTALLVVDVQEKLLPHVPHAARMVWNCARLIDACRLLEVPVAGTEQYPRGLGPTAAELAEKLGPLPEKLTFSCGGCPQIFADWESRGIHKILLCGIETHVCVQQTALDLLSAGFSVFVAIDAVGSRFALDHDTALRRMESAGATLTSVEAAIFEMCGTAAAPQFKRLSALVRQSPPQS